MLTELLLYSLFGCWSWSQRKGQIEDGLSFVVVLMCLTSIYLDGSIIQGDVLLRLTYLQSLILVIVSSTFVFELGLMVMQPRSRLDTHYLLHHLLGICGIYYQLYYRIGGGMMIRLLLDVLTDFAQNLRTYLNVRRMGRGEWPFLITFILIRLLWYPFILCMTIYPMIEREFNSLTPTRSSHHGASASIDYVFCAQLLLWFAFSTVYHWSWFRQEIKTMRWRLA